MKQILSGLAHMNSKGFFHRDIKPENILIHLGNKESQDVVVKIADFGLARPISSPPFTYYVSTRWYRAPEVILHAPNYGPPVDLFACGLILSELYTLRPMFPGTSEVDQMHVMARLLGSPEDSWGEGVQLMKKLNMNLPCTVEDVSDDAIEEKILQSIRGEKAAANLICKLIRWNPNERPTTKEALSHEYFTEQDCKVGNIGSGRLSNAESGRKAAETSIGKSNANTEPQMLNSSNDENVHLQLVSGKESGQLAENLWKNTVSNRFNTNQSSFEQPNEFCEYLNAITSSSNGAALHQDDSQRQPVHPKVTATLGQQFESKGGPLVPKFTPSARYRPRQMLSDFTPYKSSMNSVAQTIKRSTNQRRRQLLNKSSNRKRTADKPRWLLSNQNMGRRAIEVQVGHASHALEVGDGAKQNFELRQYQDERQPEKDSVWNPF
jgi:serine/threonine protein kinase